MASLTPIKHDPLWKREVRGRWRRPWTFLLLGIYAAILAILARVFYGTLVPQGEVAFSKQGLGLGAPLFWRFVTCQIVGWFPLGMLLGAPALALERERQTLSEYALAGITSHQLVRAKWWSLASFSMVLVVAPLPVVALCFPLGGLSPSDFWLANALCISVALGSCAEGLAISAIHRTVSSALLDAFKVFAAISFSIPPLAFLSDSLTSPIFLLIISLLIATLPFYLLPKIENEVASAMRYLEVDAHQIPDYPHSDGQRHIYIKPTEVANDNNTAEVDGSVLDPPPSNLDTALEALLSHNPLAQRDVRTQLRAWRRQRLIRKPSPIFSFKASFATGFLILAMIVGLSEVLNISPLAYTMWRISITLVLLQIVLLSSSAFTRERAGNMMVQIRLSALSTTEILTAKLITPFFIGVRLWGFPLLILTIATLSYDAPRIGIEAILFAQLAVFISLLGTLCSLLFRAISLSMSATLLVLAVLFLALPVIFSPMLFHPPGLLRIWWLEPSQALLWFSGQKATMACLIPSLTVMIGGLWLLCSRVWQKTSA
ncbi:hypothetical protein EON83_05480 [bacterium]|nr:MAG: hypothetical protein EON83_05480 [bacterium]